MKTSFNQLTIALAAVFTLAGCNSVDEGLQLDFEGNEPVTFSDTKLVKTYDELTLNANSMNESDQYVVAIDLLENVQNMDENMVARQIQFDDENLLGIRDADGNTPFSVVGNKLLIDTALFDEVIGTDELVKSWTYSVSYVVDNGYTYETPDLSSVTMDPNTGLYDPSTIPLHSITQQPVAEILTDGDGTERLVAITETRRELEITINGIDTPIEGILSAPSLNVVIGETTQSLVAPMPVANFYPDYQEFTWTIADTDKATVDDSGLITAISAGTTVLTVASKKDPNVTVDVDVNVALPAVTVDILGASSQVISGSLDAYSVPACSGAYLTSSLNIPEGQTFEGAANYTWESTGEAFEGAMPDQVTHNINKNTSSVYYATGDDQNGQTANLTVTSMELEDTTANVDVEIVPNIVCLDVFGFNSRFSTNRQNKMKDLSGGALVAVEDGSSFDGNGAFVVNTDAGPDIGFRNVLWSWNDSDQTKALVGFGPGRPIKASLWVKVESKSNDEPITINHYLTPFKVFNTENSWPISRTFGPQFEATVQVNNNEWQLVEFEHVDWADATNRSESFTIPANWGELESKGKSVIPEFKFSGTTPGDKILVSHYGITSGE